MYSSETLAHFERSAQEVELNSTNKQSGPQQFGSDLIETLACCRWIRQQDSSKIPVTANNAAKILRAGISMSE